MKCNLIIDTNFILNRNAFALSREKTIYGELLKSLHTTLGFYEKLYHFKNIYVVCDSKKNWRKTIYPDYKGTRKKDEKMDWEFINNTYEQFKMEVKEEGRYTLVEGDYLEGDDWISCLVKDSNKTNISCVIVASDVDINQTLGLSINPLWINIQVKDVVKHETVFFPRNYTIFLNALKNQKNSLFKLNEYQIFHQMLKDLTTRRKIVESDPQEVIFTKLVSGDKGDNIKSVLITESISKKTGEKIYRGIGDAGAATIYKEYTENYPGRIDFTSKEFAKRFIDLVKKYKKDTTTDKYVILENLFLNLKLIKLDPMFMPEDIKDSMYKKLEMLKSPVKSLNM